MGRHELSLPARMAVALVVVVVLVATGFFLVRGVTEISGTKVQAVFDRAGQGMDTNSPVKIRGITVGDVTAVDLNAKGQAVVTMHIQPGVRLPQTTAASIEPSSVFGPKFVDLRLGSGEARGPYLGAGAVITDTEGPLDLSDSLGDAYRGLDAVDPREVTVIVHTIAKGLEGKGGKMRELVDDAGTVVGVAHRHRERARRFLGDAAALSATLADKGDEIVAIGADVNTITPGLLERAEKVRVLLDQISDVSALGAHGLRKHRRNLREGVHSAERVTALIYAQLGLAGDGVRGITTLVDLLNKLIEAPGPDGNRQLQVEAFVATDICELIVGSCGPTDGRKR
ncbi:MULTISPECIES: MlaD family protein [unclassified Nonomuraea]|uniref:MlaD family protein n=1 Tax=Nonomuraea sp. NPDC003804 TaxID=3154547 RepID=UPI0033A754E5